MHPNKKNLPRGQSTFEPNIPGDRQKIPGPPGPELCGQHGQVREAPGSALRQGTPHTN